MYVQQLPRCLGKGRPSVQSRYDLVTVLSVAGCIIFNILLDSICGDDSLTRPGLARSGVLLISFGEHDCALLGHHSRCRRSNWGLYNLCLFTCLGAHCCCRAFVSALPGNRANVEQSGRIRPGSLWCLSIREGHTSTSISSKNSTIDYTNRSMPAIMHTNLTSPENHCNRLSLKSVLRTCH